MSISFDFFYQQTSHPLVQKYFSIRQELLTNTWNLHNCAGGEDIHDFDSHTLILHRDGQCLGGGRLSIPTAQTPLLPMETQTFYLPKLLPELDLHNNKYGEISSDVVIPHLQTGDYLAKIYKQILQKGRELNLKYIFAVSPIPIARKSRMLCLSNGIWMDYKTDIAIPQLQKYEGLRMRLSVLYVEEEYQPQFAEL